MDIPRDELNRQLRDLDRAQQAAAQPWQRALERLFDPDEKIDTATKAQVLGVPGRRQFLKFGGATVLGAAILAACGSDGKDAAKSSSSSSATTTTSSAAPGGAVTDLTLAKTAASLEALAVDTYQKAASSGLVTDQAVASAATLFMNHHMQHQAALNSVVTAAGSQAITTPNAAVADAIVTPALAAAKTQDDVVKLAFTLEDAAAQTYVFAAGALSKPELRSTIMTIGGIEAQHRVLLGFLVQKQTIDALFPASFYKSENPLPPNALVS